MNGSKSSAQSEEVLATRLVTGNKQQAGWPDGNGPPVPFQTDSPKLLPSGIPVQAEAVEKRGRRSLRMQIRFLHSLAFAARLFLRVLFWYYLMPKVIGQEAVDRGSTNRWVKYAREFRGFAVVMGGVMIKLGQFISTRVDVLPEEITAELAGLLMTPSRRHR